MKRDAFNLETAIETWKSFFNHRHAFFSEDTEELELHLREHIAHLMQAGRSEEEAFREATSSLGSVIDLDDEFKSVFWTKIKHKNQVVSTLLFQLSMLGNYFKTAFRNLIKHKGYSALNISGLVTGLACAFLVFMWMRNELNIDQFHENGDRLYQVKINSFDQLETSTWSNTPAPLATVLKDDFPEIESAILSMPIRASFRKGGDAGRHVGYFAGADFFDAFTFRFMAGDPSSSLDAVGKVAISDRLAANYFGNDWTSRQVVGEVITLDYWQSNGGVLGNAVRIDETREFLVSGVFENVPSTSSLQFDFVLPVDELLTQFSHLTGWGPRWFDLFVLLHEKTVTSNLLPSLQPVLSRNVPEAENQEIVIQPFTETYLRGTFEQGQPSGGKIDRVYLIGMVGLAILLIACINFTNLLTARSSQRAQEIGVRKTMGATPSLLVQQFLGESLLTAFLAFLGAIVLMIAVMPLFGSVTGLDLHIMDLTPVHWLSFLSIALITGLVAGIYPAFVLSSMNVMGIFRGDGASSSRRKVGVRHGLVIVQFTISVVLIVATLTVHGQINYLKSLDLGLDKENVVVLRVEGELQGQLGSAKAQLLDSPAIKSVSQSSASPLGVAIMTSNVNWEGKSERDEVLFKVIETDEYFAETMKLRMVSGRFFDGAQDEGRLNYIVNQEAVRVLGLDFPVGHPFALGYEVDGEGTGNGVIIGVVDDFNTGSPSDQTIGPLVFRYENQHANFLLARLESGQVGQGLTALQSMSSRFNPFYPFEYSFLDTEYQSYYKDEMVIGTLSRAFASIAIIIACLGLLGLAAFTVQQRTKEIGVRLVLGASKESLIVILSRELVLLVMISLLVGIPLSYWMMSSWLASYAYHVDVAAGTLIVASVLSVSLAVLTVGFQAHKATARRPTYLLRCE